MLYRPHRASLPRWLLLSVALLGLVLGFLGGRLSAPEPTLQALLAPAAQRLRQANGALDIVGLEYVRATQGRAGSQAATQAAVRDARQQLGQATPLRTLYPEPFQALDQTFGQLQGAVTQHAPATRVQALVDRLQAELQRLSRLGQTAP
jgi:hypothetical protein